LSTLLSAIVSILAGAITALFVCMATIRAMSGLAPNQPYAPPASHALFALVAATASFSAGAFAGGGIWAVIVSRYAGPEEVGAAIRRYTRRDDRLLVWLVRWAQRR
jgi:hypothetical protein